MKKMNDETAASIFCFVREAFMYLGLFVELATGSYWGWCLFLIDTAIQVTILYYDAKVKRLEKSLKKTRQSLARQSMEFTEHVRTHEKAEPKRTTMIFDIKSLIESRKRKGA